MKYSHPLHVTKVVRWFVLRISIGMSNIQIGPCYRMSYFSFKVSPAAVSFLLEVIPLSWS